MSVDLNMTGVNLTIVLVLFSLFPLLFLQQIFDNYPTCAYFTGGKFSENENDKLEMLDKLWEISGSGSYSKWKIIISSCGSSIPPAMGCDRDAAVCVLNSRNPRKSILNAGKSFTYTADEEDENILQSVNGQRCGKDNYTVTVKFQCLHTTKTIPSILYMDDCELRIEMMHPTCIPTPCTVREKGYLIDLRALQKLSTFSIEEPNTKKSFRLSFCKASKECDTGTSACEILSNGNKVAIASVAFQRLTYDGNTNNLVYKGHFGTSKRFRKNLEVHITCNWNVQGIANLKYINPTTQGRNFKFKGESPLACIKLPMNCLLKDIILDNYLTYNLTGLNRVNGWKVANTASKNMYINICGPLTFSTPGNSCNDRYSQVCLTHGTSQSVSLGRIPVNFHISNDKVKGSFIDGDICNLNQNLTYSTEIEFVCSAIERGPVLEMVNECIYTIKWETPAVCPKFIVEGDNCVVSDITGIIDLNGVHTTSDRSYALTETSYLRYNLCGQLNRPCNQNDHASICYIKNGKERVMGLSSKALTRSNLLLSLSMVGDTYGATARSKTLVGFICNYSAPLDGIVTVKNIRDEFLLEMSIGTPLACTQTTAIDCKLYVNESVFDLSPLSRINNNYVIRDSSSNINYIINVCRSVINTGDTLCPSNSGACLYNGTEPHLKYKYLSMGKVNERSTPSIENGNLVIKYHHGSSCPEELFHSTIIRFYCSSNDSGPRVISKRACSHEFMWHTPHACSTQVLTVKTRSTNSVCKYTNPHTKDTVDFSNINTSLNISTADGNLFTFDLCDYNYTHCMRTLNGTQCNIFRSTIKLLNDEGSPSPYLEYQLENPCLTKYHANKLHIHLLCDPLQHNEHFNIIGISDCIFHINLVTNLICTSKEQKINLYEAKKSAINEITKESNIHSAQTNNELSYTKEISQTGHQNKIEDIHVTSTNVSVDTTTFTTNENLLPYVSKSTKYHCSIKSYGFHLDLKNIKPINVTSSMGNYYTISFNKSSICNGYICKNESVIISENDKCPDIVLNYTYSVIKLLFNSYNICDSGGHNSEVWLKCSSTAYELPKIFMESKCAVKVLYPSEDACLLLPLPVAIPEIDSSNAGIAVGSSIGLIIVAAATIAGYLFFRKRSPNICSRSCYQIIPQDKERVAIYIKDSRL